MTQFLEPWKVYFFLPIPLILLLLTIFIASGPVDLCTNFFTHWLHKTFSRFSPAYIFWNGILWISYISILLIWPGVATAISILLSALHLAAIFNENDLSDQTWAWLSFSIYICLLIALIALSLIWLYNNTVNRFNDWLNSLKMRRLLNRIKDDNNQ